MPAYYTYISNECKDDASKHGQQKFLITFSTNMERQQSIENLDPYGKHFFKKDFGKSFRLIIRDYKDDDENHLVFLWRIFPKSDKNYENFKKDIQQNLERFDTQYSIDDLIKILEQKVKTKSSNEFVLPELSKAEKQFLYGKGTNRHNYAEDLFILESDEWINRTNPNNQSGQRIHVDILYDALIKVINASAEISGVFPYDDDVGIMCVKIEGTLFLIAPIYLNNKDDIAKLKEKFQNILETRNVESLLRKSHRAYPSLIVADETLWREKIQQQNDKANLALSNEEKLILQQHHYPLFINGRPGSGKSTVLQYLFADHLNNYQEYQDELKYPPIYLTYSDDLKKIAITDIASILKCNAKNIMETLSLSDEQIDSIVKTSVFGWREFLLDLLINTEKFIEDNYIGFSEFRQEYEKSYGRDSKLKKLSPEMTWYVIRMYIKGMSNDENFLDLEGFELLPSNIKSVTIDTYKLVLENIWPWYQKYCSENSLWDDQDLVREVLNLVWDGNIKLPNHPVIFCDEAQDFTRNELRLLFKLSLFSQRKLIQDNLEFIPIAFAGDPFQTLNPTGFDWDDIKANFYKIIRDQFLRQDSPQINFDFRELSFNYRSRSDIVQLCNFIHLLRGITLGKQNLYPQKTWFTDATNIPVYFDINNEIFKTRVEDQKEIVIILPCQEGEEIDYVRRDPTLNKFALKEGVIVRNIFSPMRAKGLEYERVILYKFGNECVEKYPELLKSIDPNEPIYKIPEENFLEYEYFINRLYVAASRAKNKIIIIDTQRGIQDFWKNNFVNKSPADFIEKYKQIWKADKKDNKFPWDVSDLVKIQQGRSADWDDYRDDPITLAKRFRDLGRNTKDPEMMRYASNNFRLAKKESDALECDAYKFEYAKNYYKSAEIWQKLGNSHRARQLYWKSKAYIKIVDMNENTIEYKAATFMLNTNSLNIENLQILITDIEHSLDQGDISIDQVWKEVIRKLFNRLREMPEDELKPYEWKDVWSKAKRFFEQGLLSQDVNEIIDQFQVRSASYHEKLILLDKVGSDPKQIIKYYNENKTEKLDPDEVRIVFAAMMNTNDIKGQESLINEYPSIDNYLRKIVYNINLWKKELKHKESRENDIYEWTDKLINFLVKNSFFEDAIDFVTKPEHSDISADENKLLKDYQWNKFRLEALLIKRLSVSDELVKSRIPIKNTVSKYLNMCLLRNPNNYVNLVTIQQAGAAIERAGKWKDCLEFYEMVFKERSWPVNDEGQWFAKDRWLKCKYKQIELTNGDNKKRTIQGEINSLMRDWNIEDKEINGLTEFPTVDMKAIPVTISKKHSRRLYTPDNLQKESINLNNPIKDLLEDEKNSPVLPQISSLKNGSNKTLDVDSITQTINKSKRNADEKTQSPIITNSFNNINNVNFIVKKDLGNAEITIILKEKDEIIHILAEDLEIYCKNREFNSKIERLKHLNSRSEYFITPWNITCILKKTRNRQQVYLEIIQGKNGYNLYSTILKN